jgi:hypothetical protein
MSRWTAVRGSEHRVNEHLLLKAQRSESGRWWPGVVLLDGLFIAELSPRRVFAAGYGRATSEQQAQAQAEALAKELGDVRPWLALMRCFGALRWHVRRARRAA